MSAQDGHHLLIACNGGDIRRTRSLVSSGTSVDYEDETGLTPSICCCFDGGLPRILQYLIDRGADTNKAHIEGGTPLYVAAEFNSHQCLSLLLQNGADANRANVNGCTPLQMAAEKNHHQCVSLLVQHGVDASSVDNDGSTALHFAAYFNGYECVSQFLNHGVAVDAITSLGETALWWASLKGHLSVVELLVQEGGSDFEIADIHGETALDAAEEEGHTAVVRFLRIESNWRRRRNYATMLSSIWGVPTDSKMMKVFQCHDVARVIASYV
jgi:ankyrin repeat protein